MNKKYYVTSQKACKITGLKAQTLRHYSETGILQIKWLNGKRRYLLHDLHKINPGTEDPGTETIDETIGDNISQTSEIKFNVIYSRTNTDILERKDHEDLDSQWESVSEPMIQMVSKGVEVQTDTPCFLDLLDLILDNKVDTIYSYSGAFGISGENILKKICEKYSVKIKIKKINNNRTGEEIIENINYLINNLKI
jgi:predicted site-specific integrase-resolvase